MDDKLIIDFINNIDPNMSYGSSDGMTRAMVESAENMALINDYIVESTYEVYNEAEENDKQGFFKKAQDKIHTYFTLFVNIIKKAIEKFKGYFLTLKRKLTVAMAKVMKGISEKIMNLASQISAAKLRKGYKGEMRIKLKNTAFNTYEIDDKMYDALVKEVKISNEMLNFMTVDNNHSLEEIEDYCNGIRDDFDNKFVNPKPDETAGSVLLKYKTDKLSVGTKELKDEMKASFADIDHVMDDFYNCILKSHGDMLNTLKKEEKNAIHKISNNPKELSAALKRINKFIHVINYTKYKGGQLVASACLKIYKKCVSEAIRLLKTPPELKRATAMDTFMDEINGFKMPELQ